MIVNFDSLVNLKVNLAKGIAMIAIKVIVAFFTVLFLMTVVSCGQINDAGGEAIQNLTETGVKVNESVDKVTGTLGGEAGKASRVALRALEDIRIQAADNPEYEQVIDDNEAFLDELCIEHDPNLMTEREYNLYCVEKIQER